MIELFKRYGILAKHDVLTLTGQSQGILDVLVLGAGTDYTATSDVVLTPSWNPGWVGFDVSTATFTAKRVHEWGVKKAVPAASTDAASGSPT